VPEQAPIFFLQITLDFGETMPLHFLLARAASTQGGGSASIDFTLAYKRDDNSPWVNVVNKKGRKLVGVL
jgi:hypothetical protein